MKRALSLLVVDDEAAMRKVFTDLATARPDLRVEEARDGIEALELLQRNDYDAAFLDIQMPRMGGMRLLGEAKKVRPSMEIIMMTGFGSIESAVEAMKLGASDYLTKPLKKAQITLALDRLVKVKGLLEENEILRDQLREKFRAQALVGMTPAMEGINRLIDKVRSEDCTVLILGESGTGKDLIARAIHYEGSRQGGLFVPVDCAAISKNLLESELFGHVKGAFTGAHARRSGLFERAHRGTLFLDEVAEIPVELQATLLRALEEKQVRPVGSTVSIDVDVRIVAATNRDLAQMVAAGQFRQDLFYRLNVVTIEVPPLRMRKDDVPLLVEFLVRRLDAKRNRPVRGVTREALDALIRYNWPGNVRELEHVIERACTLGKGERIEVEDLPPSLLERTKRRLRKTDTRSLKEIEADEIRRLLAESRGNTDEVSKALQIDRSTLYRKLRRYGINLSKLKFTP